MPEDGEPEYNHRYFVPIDYHDKTASTCTCTCTVFVLSCKDDLYQENLHWVHFLNCSVGTWNWEHDIIAQTL